MSSLTDSLCGAEWRGRGGGRVSLPIPTLPSMCLFTDGGLDMAFYVILYSLRKQEKWDESGENSTGAVVLSHGSDSHPCKPVLRVLAQHFAKWHL